MKKNSSNEDNYRNSENYPRLVDVCTERDENEREEPEHWIIESATGGLGLRLKTWNGRTGKEYYPSD